MSRYKGKQVQKKNKKRASTSTHSWQLSTHRVLSLIPPVLTTYDPVAPAALILTGSTSDQSPTFLLLFCCWNPSHSPQEFKNHGLSRGLGKLREIMQKFSFLRPQEAMKVSEPAQEKHGIKAEWEKEINRHWIWTIYHHIQGLKHQ